MIPSNQQLRKEDLNLYNNFMKEFSGSNKAAYNNIKGRINNIVSDILIASLNGEGYPQFQKLLKDVSMPNSLKNKALHYAKPYFELRNIKIHQAFSNSIFTQKFEYYDFDFNDFNEEDKKELSFLMNCCSHPKLALAIMKASVQGWSKKDVTDPTESHAHFVARKLNSELASRNIPFDTSLSMQDLGITN